MSNSNTQHRAFTGMSDLEKEIKSTQIDERGAIERISDVYFAPKSFEKSGKLYEALGVQYWKEIVMGTVGRVFKKIGINKSLGTYFIGLERNKETIKKYELLARIIEVIHVPLTIIGGIGLVYDLSNENYGSAIGSGIGFMFNLYCTMLQRYNRARVYNVLERMNARERNAPSSG